MTYALRYIPGTDLGRRFPTWSITTYRTREAAEDVRHECRHPEQVEVVEVDE